MATRRSTRSWVCKWDRGRDPKTPSFLHSSHPSPRCICFYRRPTAAQSLTSGDRRRCHRTRRLRRQWRTLSARTREYAVQSQTHWHMFHPNDYRGTPHLDWSQIQLGIWWILWMQYGLGSSVIQIHWWIFVCKFLHSQQTHRETGRVIIA